jgi:CheY-like chemotaxis protein
MIEDVQEYRAAGVDGVLAKPIDLQELRRVIRDRAWPSLSKPMAGS